MPRVDLAEGINRFVWDIHCSPFLLRHESQALFRLALYSLASKSLFLFPGMVSGGERQPIEACMPPCRDRCPQRQSQNLGSFLSSDIKNGHVRD